MNGTLYIVATPIGNLEDITKRALRVIADVDILYCEDTRHTRRVLDRYDIRVRTESYREEVHAARTADIINHLREGKNIALVSDAGTPGISDPGNRLVRSVLSEMPEAIVVPIPGPSALVAAFSVAGFPSDAFTFLGFPPHKKGRAKLFREAMATPHPVILYESPHRIVKAMDAIAQIDPLRRLCVCRELTKMHETIYRGTAAEVLSALEASSTKGEFVIIIEGAKN